MPPYGSPDKTDKPSPKKPEKQLTAKDVMERYISASRVLTGDAWNYWLNHAYLIGEQWLYVNQQNNTLTPIAQDPSRVQATVNRMWPASRTIMAKLLSRELQFNVPPTGADDATLRAARTSESILRAVTREHNWESLREQGAWGVWKGGTAAFCVNWDPQAGTPLGITDNEETNGRPFGTGDTVEEALSITDFVVEPGVRDAETARWWIKAVARTPEQVQNDYNLSEVPEADATAATTPFQRKLLSTSVGHSDSSDVALRLTRVFVLYERPNPLCEDGQVVTVVADKVVDRAPWPFPFKEHLNLVLFRETVIEGTWTGETILKAARPIQRAINQSWSAIIEHMKLAGNARLFVPQSAMDMMDQLTDLPGEIVPYPDGSTHPEYTSPPSMPMWWIQEPEKLRDELDDTLGVHDVSRGEAPGRVDSALAISILVEQDSSPIGRLTKEMAGAFGRLASMVLELYQANVKETRSATVQIPGQPARTIPWSGSHLRNQTVAEVPSDAIMPRSRAAQQAFADKALQGGLITTLHEWYKLADIPMDQDLLEFVSPDVGKARRENAAMARNEVMVPAPFDDHTIHIGEHLTFMKSAEWDLLDDKMKEVFISHNQAHETMAAEALGAQQLKSQFSPVLGAAPSAEGTPTLPMEAMPGAAPQGGGAPPSPPVGDLVQQQNPGIPQSVIGSELPTSM